MENWRDEVQARIVGMDTETLQRAFDSALRLVWVHMENVNRDIGIRRVEIRLLDSSGAVEVTALSEPRRA